SRSKSSARSSTRSSRCVTRPARRIPAFPSSGCPRIVGLVTAACIVAVISGAAAADKVSIRPAPTPGQVVHVRAEQEILLRSGENAELPGPAVMESRNAVAYTQTNGAFDAQGHLEARIAVEKLELNETLRGTQRRDMNPSAVSGRVITATFDRT